MDGTEGAGLDQKGGVQDGAVKRRGVRPTGGQMMVLVSFGGEGANEFSRM